MRLFAFAAIALVPGLGVSQLKAVNLVTVPGNALGYYPHPTNTRFAYVVEKTGAIRIINNNIVGAKFLQIPTADMSSNGERGLLGFAFHPEFKTNGYVFVLFTLPSGNIQISRFTRSAAGWNLGYASRYDVLQIPHYQYPNHNGGTIHFGPDKYLYISIGDGGSANDPNNNAQNTNVLLGKLLRIDVDRDHFASTSRNYAIPTGNPFKGITGKRGEIWAYGLRNPYKFSFDTNGDIYIGDVGQSTREEVDRILWGTKGQNFGWRALEGTVDNPGVEDAPPANAVPPIFDYPRTTGRCITGGRVYRGSLLGAQYVGRYFFADYVSSRIFSIDPNASDVWASLVDHTADLAISTPKIVSIDFDHRGELVLCDITGKIYLITTDA